MRVAMIGQKGVPASHGGVERHVEELGVRLVGLGHEVTVFTRPEYTDSSLTEYRGMTLRSVPTLHTKHLDAIVHSALCSLACWSGEYDVVHYHAIGPCLVSPLVKVRGRRVVATIHGQDWRRGKWGRAATAILRLSEWMALHVPDATISVSETLQSRYLKEAGRTVDFIPNGITIDEGDDQSVLTEFGLVDGEYLLFAGRLVPEKGAHHLIAAHRQSGITTPLVIAGDASHSDEYVEMLRASAGSNVIFTGYQYGARLASLFRHTALFVLPSELEGLPIVLLEALAYGAPVLASDIDPNVEVLGVGGNYFVSANVEGLADALRRLTAHSVDLRVHAQLEVARVRALYDWDAVARDTSLVYSRIVRDHAKR